MFVQLQVKIIHQTFILLKVPVMSEWSWSAFTLGSVSLSHPLAFHFLSWWFCSGWMSAPSWAVLGIICYDINFKCLLAFKARQQIQSIKVNGAFYSTGLWNWSYRLQRKLNTLWAQSEGEGVSEWVSRRRRGEDVCFGLKLQRKQQTH